MDGREVNGSDVPSVDLAPYPTAESRFRAGVEALFSVWGALDAMREHMTGGVETEEKIEDMMEGVIELFEFTPKSRARVNQIQLEDMFFDFTENELATVLEDGSVEQIAEYTFRLFRELERNEDTVLRKLLFAQAKRRRVKPRPVVLEVSKPEDDAAEHGSHEEEEEEDDGEDDDEDDEDEDEEAQKEGKGEEDSKRSEDSDGGGWTVVGKKKGK